MMVAETPNDPARVPPARLATLEQSDFFVCDIADAALKDLIPSLEHPFYTLAKKPMLKVREYQRGNHWLRILPSTIGMATIYDKDILIYAVSQVVAAMNQGYEPQQRVRINSRDFLMFTGRGQGGKDYAAICDSITRLDGTRIQTNIKTGDEEQFDTFGLIESGSVRRKHGLKGRLIWIELKLSDWIFNGIRAKELLTLHPDYFQLSRPIARRLYELARKHCGQKTGWPVYVSTLYEKSGSGGSLKQFREYVKEISVADNLPDYSMIYDGSVDMVIFSNRNTMPLDRLKPDQEAVAILIRLSTDIGERAKQIAQGWDIQYVMRCFAAWWVKIGKPETKNADALFLKFCHTWQARNGRP